MASRTRSGSWPPWPLRLRSPWPCSRARSSTSPCRSLPGSHSVSNPGPVTCSAEPFEWPWVVAQGERVTTGADCDPSAITICFEYAAGCACPYRGQRLGADLHPRGSYDAQPRTKSPSIGQPLKRCLELAPASAGSGTHEGCVLTRRPDAFRGSRSSPATSPNTVGQ
jgi:hypothetical protein